LRRPKGGSLVPYVLLVLLVREKKEGGLDARLYILADKCQDIVDRKMCHDIVDNGTTLKVL